MLESSDAGGDVKKWERGGSGDDAGDEIGGGGKR